MFHWQKMTKRMLEASRKNGYEERIAFLLEKMKELKVEKMILARCIVSAHSGNRLALGEHYGLVESFNSHNVSYYRVFAIPDVLFKEDSVAKFVPSPRLSTWPCSIEPKDAGKALGLEILGVFATHRFEFLFQEEELKVAKHVALERMSFTSGEYRQQGGEVADPSKS